MLIKTPRDKQIEIFIEKYKGITTQQARYIFYSGNEKSAIRRLNQFEELKVLDAYYVSKNKVYKLLEGKKLKEHDILILDFYSWVYKNGGEVLEFIKTPHYFKNQLIPDALVKFKIPYQGNYYLVNVLLEIDYTHYTENIKLNTWYEKLYREGLLKEFCGKAEFPFVVIARPTTGIRYNSNNFNIIYTDLKFSNLLEFLFS